MDWFDFKSKMEINYLFITKICFSLLLFLTFSFFFGLPAYRKYAAKEIISESKIIGMEKVRSPALTFCPKNKQTAYGWKNTNKFREPNISLLCETPETADDIYKCLDEKTYKVTDFIPEHVIGNFVWDRNQRNTINSSFWNRESVIKLLGVLFI